MFIGLTNKTKLDYYILYNFVKLTFVNGFITDEDGRPPS